MNTTMKIESPRFGTLEVDLNKTIEFPNGLPGFEDCRMYTVLHPSDDAKYFILQSLDDPTLAFNVADPGQLGFTYEIALSDDESAAIGSGQPEDFAVAVMLSKMSDDAPLSANLNAPLVINLATRRGIQHVFARLDYSVVLKGA